MRHELYYFAQPVRSLQGMLRTISFQFPSMPRVATDGIFDEKTLEAVMILQRDSGLPVTGVVDFVTWDETRNRYLAAQHELALPYLHSGFPSREHIIHSGDVCLHLFHIQAMFHALSLLLDPLEPTPITGTHSGASVRNTFQLQRAMGVTETGAIDVHTWNHLARLHQLLVTRNPYTDSCEHASHTTHVPPDGVFPPRPLTQDFPWEPY